MTKTLAAPLESELIIKKSRFLGRIEAITSQQEGLLKVEALRKSHPEARHVCYCLLVAGQVRQSDDGEPSGTAALPMLRVLQHKQLDNVLATVVRYFGGIKLGAGGLVRAYSQAISEPLNQAELIEVKQQGELSLKLDYEFQSLLRHQVEQTDIELTLDYQQQIHALLQGEPEKLETLYLNLREATRGQVERLG
ncbi:IMPACT family protein [Marinospirillum sp.]|uniref:IMPACT family protein n=1 Tax=Marinospirillum sp. TaxID=2183934 RepID=UPI00384D2B9E